jgi:DNA modification methylase
MSWEIRTCDVLDGLRSMVAGSVQCCVTSPPYFALRDYGVAGQLGLEKTPDEYIAKMVEVFREVRRVLRDDGTLWLNIGDSYSTGAGKVGNCPGGGAQGDKAKGIAPMTQANRMPLPGIKPKDLIGIPWQLAFALRADGWYLRSEIIWSKRSPMPESVRDRPTKAHEQVFLLTKSPRYFYDSVASAEKSADGANGSSFITGKSVHGQHNIGLTPREDNTAIRNMRSVWRLSSELFPGAHFATYPTELVRRCLLAGTREGSVVLDPFAGAGTTIVVARRLGLRAIGFELNPTYAEMARQRVRDDMPLFNKETA